MGRQVFGRTSPHSACAEEGLVLCVAVVVILKRASAFSNNLNKQVEHFRHF